MASLVKYLLKYQQYSLLNISVLLFIISIISKGNSGQVGLGFVSIAAIPAILIIIFGAKNIKLDLKDLFFKCLFFIFLYVVYSSIFRSESIVSIYSIVGNLLLCVIIYQSFNSGLKKMVIDSFAFILAFVFLSFYLGGFWEVRTMRYSYLGMNPNLVSELISYSLIALVTLLYRFKHYKMRFSLILVIVLCVCALMPLLSTISRKGIVLGFSVVLAFFSLKYRLYNPKYLPLILMAGISIWFLTTIYIDNRSGSELVQSLHYRFYDAIDKDANHRLYLLERAFKKGLESPLIGFGLDSSRSPMFLKSIGLWNPLFNQQINTHNGLLNIFLKGGIVFLTLYLFVFFIPIIRGIKMILNLSDSLVRDEIIFSVLAVFIFFIHVISSGNGELYKPGWLVIGFAMGLINYAKKRIGLEHQQALSQRYSSKISARKFQQSTQ